MAGAAIGRFDAAHPEIDLRTVASERLADFRADGVDIAIRQGRPPFGAGMRSVLLAPLDLCAVCSPGYAETAGPIRQFADLASHRLIQDGHAYWEALFEEAGAPPRHRMIRFNQTALAMDAAANGRGVALAPRLLLEDEMATGGLIALWRDRSAGGSGDYIIHPETRKPNPARDAVTAWILSEAS